MPEKISILKESGETLSSNIVSVFLIPDTEKKYIITTENAVDPHGLTVLHVSEFVDGALKKVATDEEWSSIKTIMRAIISGNVGSYKYLPKIENATAEGQYSRDISVSASASKQMIENYNAADTSEEEAPAEENAEAATDAAAETAPAEGAAPEAEAAPEATPEPPVEPSNIFPEKEEPKNEENEVMAGIEEVPAPAAPEAPEAPAAETPTVPEVPVPVDITPPAPVPNPDLNNDVQVPNLDINAQVPVTPGVPVGQPVDAGAAVPGAISVLPIEPNLNPGVQVAIPAQTIPTSQIVQGPQEMGMQMATMPIDMNATPSFNPNATLDEVVVGAQEMFMAGVKNLVQTIQEKVYRELYTKEAELKERERIIENKEAMLNSQFATMMNNFTANFNGAPVQSQMFPQPNMMPQMNTMNTMSTPMMGNMGMMPQVPQAPGMMPNNMNNTQV